VRPRRGSDLLEGRGPAGNGLYTSRGGQGVGELVSGALGDDPWDPGGSGRVVGWGRRESYGVGEGVRERLGSGLWFVDWDGGATSTSFTNPISSGCVVAILRNPSPPIELT